MRSRDGVMWLQHYSWPKDRYKGFVKYKIQELLQKKKNQGVLKIRFLQFNWLTS